MKLMQQTIFVTVTNLFYSVLILMHSKTATIGSLLRGLDLAAPDMFAWSGIMLLNQS